LTQGLPHSKDCFVCGDENPDGFRLRFEVDEEGRVLLRFNARESMQGFHQVMHGGLQATLLDEAMAWASAVALTRMTIAAELNVRYIERTPLESDLVIEAWTSSKSSKLARTEAVLKDEAGTVYAKASGKFFPLSEDETKFVDSHLIYNEGDARIFEALGKTSYLAKPPPS